LKKATFLLLEWCCWRWQLCCQVQSAMILIIMTFWIQSSMNE